MVSYSHAIAFLHSQSDYDWANGGLEGRSTLQQPVEWAYSD